MYPAPPGALPPLITPRCNVWQRSHFPAPYTPHILPEEYMTYTTATKITTRYGTCDCYGDLQEDSNLYLKFDRGDGELDFIYCDGFPESSDYTWTNWTTAVRYLQNRYGPTRGPIVEIEAC